MTGQRTAKPLRVTELLKARLRLILLLIVAGVCPPLAGVRSAPVWIFYVAFVLIYSLWATRLVRNFADDRRLGFLLSVTDIAILLPLLVWTDTASMQTILGLLCAAGLVFSYYADRHRMTNARRSRYGSRSLLGWTTGDRASEDDTGVPLERALRVRLKILEAAHSRFALVVLRVVRFEEMSSYYGEEAADHLLGAVSRRGLRLLGPDAQHFVLPGGRVAFVFATGEGTTWSNPSQREAEGWIDPYDVETLAMTVARKACEHLVDGHRVECVVGWASAPADGMTPEDLMNTAESGMT